MSSGTHGRGEPACRGLFAARRNLAANLERVYELFPPLTERRKALAGYLSGGEQQMLAIRTCPDVTTRRSFILPSRLRISSAANARHRCRDQRAGHQRPARRAERDHGALQIAHHGYVFETGRVVMDRPADELLGDEDVREFYLGLGPEAETRKSFRDVKHTSDASAGRRDMNQPVLEFDDVELVVRRGQGDQRRLVHRQRRRTVRAHRAQRRREDERLQRPVRRIPPTERPRRLPR